MIHVHALLASLARSLELGALETLPHARVIFLAAGEPACTGALSPAWPNQTLSSCFCCTVAQPQQQVVAKQFSRHGPLQHSVSGVMLVLARLLKASRTTNCQRVRRPGSIQFEGRYICVRSLDRKPSPKKKKHIASAMRLSGFASKLPVLRYARSSGVVQSGHTQA